MSTRGYYNSQLAEAAIHSWSDEEDEREKLRPGSGLDLRSKRAQSSPLRGIIALLMTHIFHIAFLVTFTTF